MCFSKFCRDTSWECKWTRRKKNIDLKNKSWNNWHMFVYYGPFSWWLCLPIIRYLYFFASTNLHEDWVCTNRYAQASLKNLCELCGCLGWNTRKRYFSKINASIVHDEIRHSFICIEIRNLFSFEWRWISYRKSQNSKRNNNLYK